MGNMKRFVPFLKADPVVAVVRLSGVISTGRAGLNDAVIAPVLEKAFRRGKPAAVALVINSPGGSPAQSSLIAARIRRLSEEHDVPVHAFVEDVAASGGYWLACSAGNIVVDPNSITGSIGVISASFGFDKLLDRFGVERRVHTVGGAKSFMDPFQPEKTEDVERLKQLQEAIHENFVAQVRARRGDRLNPEVKMFGGEIFVGRNAVEAGLADEVGHLVPTMRKLFGDKVRFRRYGIRRNPLAFLGASLARGAVGSALESAEARDLWSRYGL
ncbi:serine protease SohB [Brevirhabdus pacifica]|nr:serine protease SohB [Brevirhabdus pacifica]